MWSRQGDVTDKKNVEGVGDVIERAVTGGKCTRKRYIVNIQCLIIGFLEKSSVYFDGFYCVMKSL